MDNIRMRYAVGISDWRTARLKPEIVPMLYKTNWKEKWFVIKSVGIIGALIIYWWERKQVHASPAKEE